MPVEIERPTSCEDLAAGAAYGGAVTWDPGDLGVMALPSGRLVRGRSLREPVVGSLMPTVGVYLLARPPAAPPWEAHWVRWPDFRLPTDPAALRSLLLRIWERAPSERAEVGCHGGRGRTGTALACLAVIDGVPAADATAFVRQHYSPHAVETRGQRAFVASFLPR